MVGAPCRRNLNYRKGDILQKEFEVGALLGLLEQFVPRLPANKVTVNFGDEKGFGLRVHPDGQSVSNLFYHNGREWRMLREDGSTPASDLGWRPDELEMVSVTIVFLAAQLACDYKFILRLPNMQDAGQEKQETYGLCLDGLVEMSASKNLSKSARKWAQKALVALDSMD